MTMKHSPGPWEVSRLATPDYAPEFGIFRDDPAGAPCLARTMNENSEANARLIAAAPELLAALRALTATARTFRNVPKSEQEWTPLDDEALAASFAVLAMVQP